LPNDLPKHWLPILKFTDHFINTPSPLPHELFAEITDIYTKAEITEIALGLGLFHGFSKMLIALGREPVEMDTTIIPTPTAPMTKLEIQVPDSHPVASLLSPTPDLRDRWIDLENTLWKMNNYPRMELEKIRSRLATLLDVSLEYENFYHSGDSSRDLQNFSDQFVFDIRSFTDEQRRAIIDEFGSDGLLNLMICLALYDGIFRVATTLDSWH
jgi:hypothetical protein